jgi:BirA family biotin operon repressor/biotin-[acetyl-CoA-carboxylase] ligase
MSADTALRLARCLAADAHRSGERIAAELGCTRGAVWKHAEALRGLGIAVEAVPGRGYRLAEPIELLDAEALTAALAGHYRDVRVESVIDSTSRRVAARRPGERHRVAVFAEGQTAGRGRRGRGWFSPPGRNVYVSVGWRFDRGIAALACLPLVTALATARALDAVGLAGHGIKWPNDLWLADRKLAGCLVEIQGDAHGPCEAIVGVGVNVHMRPDVEGAGGIDQPWTSVGQHLPSASRNALARRLAAELADALEEFADAGFEAQRKEWAARDVLRGRRVRVEQGEKTITGVASGVGREGGLLVDTGATVVECHSAEVSVRPADSA